MQRKTIENILKDFEKQTFYIYILAKAKMCKTFLLIFRIYIISFWPFVHCVRNLFVFTDQLENCCLIIPTFEHFTHHIVREGNQFLLV